MRGECFAPWFQTKSFTKETIMQLQRMLTWIFARRCQPGHMSFVRQGFPGTPQINENLLKYQNQIQNNLWMYFRLHLCRFKIIFRSFDIFTKFTIYVIIFDNACPKILKSSQRPCQGAMHGECFAPWFQTKSFTKETTMQLQRILNSTSARCH